MEGFHNPLYLKSGHSYVKQKPIELQNFQISIRFKFLPIIFLPPMKSDEHVERLKYYFQ